MKRFDFLFRFPATQSPIFTLFFWLIFCFSIELIGYYLTGQEGCMNGLINSVFVLNSLFYFFIIKGVGNNNEQEEKLEACSPC